MFLVNAIVDPAFTWYWAQPAEAVMPQMLLLLLAATQHHGVLNVAKQQRAEIKTNFALDTVMALLTMPRKLVTPAFLLPADSSLTGVNTHSVLSAVLHRTIAACATILLHSTQRQSSIV